MKWLRKKKITETPFWKACNSQAFASSLQRITLHFNKCSKSGIPLPHNSIELPNVYFKLNQKNLQRIYYVDGFKFISESLYYSFLFFSKKNAHKFCWYVCPFPPIFHFPRLCNSSWLSGTGRMYVVTVATTY